MSTSTDGVKRRHPLAKCEDCSLNNKDAVFVPSTKPKTTELIIVGEAPGVQEGRTGKPFTGPSGKLLDAVLRGHSLSRDTAFITNACLCRPKNNATPGALDVAACAPRLKHELDVERENGAPIIALGNVATGAIFGEKVTITTFRAGPARESIKYPGTKIVPTLHPAYVLRSSDAFPLFQEDVGKVKVDVDVRWEPPTFRVFDEESEACAALRELQKRGGDMVVDIECGFDKDTEFIHPDQYRLLCVGFCYAPGRAIVIGEAALQSGRRSNGTSRVRDMLRSLLESPGVRIIAHNGKFDLAGLRSIAPRATLGFDTMLASYAVSELPGIHGLKYLAREKLGAPQYDAEIYPYLDKDKNYANIPRDILYKYNAYDVACTWLLKDLYEATMTDDEKRVNDMLCRASDMLMKAEMSGLTVDIPYTQKLADEYQLSLNALEGLLSRWVVNPRSPKQVKEAFAKLGINLDSTAVEYLEYIRDRLQAKSGLADEAREFATQMLGYRKEHKLYSTYIRGIQKRLYKEHVHPSFLLHGTTTGRLACRNPNLQNIPRESSIRRMYISSPGRTFVQADYKGAELRVMACEAEDLYLKQLFADGRDIHSEIALEFFGPGFTKDDRVRAKAVVFGLSYGREAKNLAYEFDIPVYEAQRWLDKFFSLMPEITRWRASIKDQILNGEEDLVTHFGRHRRIWLVTPDNVKDVVREGLAFIPQSTASDICLHAAMILHENFNYDIRLLVHDSILVECDPSEVEDISIVMNEVMPAVAAKVYSDFVPFEVEVTSAGSWGDL